MANINRKDSTNDLPMCDLQEAVKIVATIREKALETAPMPMVAKGCGYGSPTSTPFYRRMAAARLFKLLNSPRPELTKIALDYLKPDKDDAKRNALTQAVMGIKKYAEIVKDHEGKKINLELVTNKLEKDLELAITDVCARICASVFVSSIKFAGFISVDGTLIIPSGLLDPSKIVLPVESLPAKDLRSEELEDQEESQIQTLYLDSKRKRKITIRAPFTVSKEELERIRAWLGFQLIIEEAKPNIEN